METSLESAVYNIVIIVVRSKVWHSYLRGDKLTGMQ